MNNLNRQQVFRFIVVLFLIGIALYSYSQGSLDLGQVVPQPAEPSPTEEPGLAGNSGEFDFYVLTLSWSPDYCASSGSQDPQECSIGRKLGFVFHGLWPQYDKGYPSDCSNVRLPQNLKLQFAGLYPDTALFDHEWDKHGTCSGLAPEQYLALSKKLKDSITIPDAYRAPEQPFRVTTSQLKKDVMNVNALLRESSLAVYCSGSGRFLQELYVCFSLDGKPTSCSAEIQNKASRSCQNPDFLVRNVR